MGSIFLTVFLCVCVCTTVPNVSCEQRSNLPPVVEGHSLQQWSALGEILSYIFKGLCKTQKVHRETFNSLTLSKALTLSPSPESLVP